MGPLVEAQTTSEGENPFWNEVLDHPTYDAFWSTRDIRPHVENVKAAVLTVGGWFDAEDPAGPLALYKAVEEEPRRRNHSSWARGCTAAGRAATAIGSARSNSIARPESATERDRVPFLRGAPEGQGRERAPESVGVRDRHQYLAALRGLAARPAHATRPQRRRHLALREDSTAAGE